jgi:hypothetical protein
VEKPPVILLLKDENVAVGHIPHGQQVTHYLHRSAAVDGNKFSSLDAVASALPSMEEISVSISGV